MEAKKPLVIIVMDGFGVSEPSEGNAISIAKKPVLDNLISYYPHSCIQASGELVGLPWGEVGNSEVGHMNIGSGRVMYQDLPRINKAITDGSFFTNEKFLGAFEHVKKNKSKLHIMGLLSTGGVHSHIDHLFALLEAAKKNKVKKVYIHAIMDGRDVPPQSGPDFIKETEQRMKKLRTGEWASVSGRFYAMDRDENWDRMQKSYDVMVKGTGEGASSPLEALEQSYKNNITDEKVDPVYIGKKGKPVALIEDRDAIMHFDYRSDRARLFTQIFANPEFSEFDRGTNFTNLKIVTMTDYNVEYPVDIAFPPEPMPDSLGAYLSNSNKKQLRIAETEKYAHVTMFFNCGQLDPFPGEDRQLVQSPAVESYDLKPEMSAYRVTDKLLAAIGNYDFVLLNYANPDMVGHTGKIPAAAKGIEAVDECIGKVVEKTLSLDGKLIITGDHGNADVMLNLQTHEVVKDHTVNPVPIIIVGNDRKYDTSTNETYKDLYLKPPIGVLADVTVTAIDMMGMEKPPVMTGVSLSQVI